MSGPVLLLSALHEPTQGRLEERYTVHHLYKSTDKAALLASMSQCPVAVTTGGRGIDAATMAALPGLKLVVCFGVGVDAIDLAY
ncbi:MAG: 2-hydroxyacid dehydrogenase, partial [Burkholderiales bacterium]